MNNKIVVLGSSSTLTVELEKFRIELVKLGRSEKLKINFSDECQKSLLENIPLNERFYVINAGYLLGKKILDLSSDELKLSANINLFNVVKVCEYILEKNPISRIIILGSESGRKGSFDTVYFLCKSALRSYVRQRSVGIDQQIVLISPSTIEDSNMTINRIDSDRLSEYKNNHPKKRFLKMSEIASLVNSIFFHNSTYLTNIEVELNGGKFARM
jgi:NADP-dependent 3-hydroxy acid dehydrogenase YdfG